MKLLFDCRTAARLLSQSQDDAPPRINRARIRLHLMNCAACRTVDEQMRFVRTAVLVLRVTPQVEMPVVEQHP
jgi:predicted anti-sigma-YlaC factor YlaD